MSRFLPLVLLLLLFLSTPACTVGPDYRRPEYPVPNAYRGEKAGRESIGDLEWFFVYKDPVLRSLITEALHDNYDLRIAAERVLEARARVTIVKSERYPTVDGGVEADLRGATRNGPVPLGGADREQETAIVAAGLSWEIDFWGRVSRATEAARAELFASELGRRAVIQSLVADLAFAYFELLELDLELEITRASLASRIKSRDLVKLRLDHGVANKVEFHQAEGLVITTERIVPQLQSRIEQQENLIRLLAGRNPGPVPRGVPLRKQRIADVPAGMPSQLLERRPDIRVAEQNLVAANARIGEAKALLYPTIRLTGSGGVASDQLKNLFEGDSVTWTLLPSVSMPIFNAGRLRANVAVSESRQRQAALRYLQTLQQAFREVADALIARQKTREVTLHQRRFESTLADQTRLSNARYRGGVTDYLEYLDSERDHFDAELDLARSIRDELLSTVVVYRALGGGWKGTQNQAAKAPGPGPGPGPR